MVDYDEKIVYQGKLFEIVQKDVWWKVFEIARRAPGIRLLVIDGDKILLTKEWRHEHWTYDYRLPGGKVFDTLEEFNRCLFEWKDMLSFVEAAAKEECEQEAWILAHDLRLLSVSKAGATVEWDLYYFVVEKFNRSPEGQSLEDGEDISVEWKTKEEVKQLCLDGLIMEDRTVGILLKFLLR